MEHLGIIGRGITGLRVAAELRERGYTGRITTWDPDPNPPYDRPALSKQLFGEYHHPLALDSLGDFTTLGVAHIPERVTKISAAKTPNPGWIIESGAETEAGTEAGAGRTTRVDGVVVATGSAPHATIRGAHVLYDVTDAESLRAAISPGARVHIIGAGWIGTELASVASEQGAEVDMWEASESILARNFGGAVDSYWLKWLENAGVGIHLGTAYPKYAPPDVLIQATGARPSLSFLSDYLSPRGGLTTNIRGEVTDLGVPVTGLFAGGDCADLALNGSWRWGGHWTKTLGDAARIAATICGSEFPARLDPPEVFSTQFGHEIGFVGEVPEDSIPEVFDDGEKITLTWWKAKESAAGNPPENELAAVLGIDAPREVSRARKKLRINLQQD